ncbi:hypothetical protein [Plantactinospora sp. CA-290183]|uniref:hypothetical protein n=1 Tax=Plantactinospora sp. CA-290183 TaxID=3240006 RepID=UPI003D8D7B45
MRWLTLYLRSRRVPMALVTAAACVAVAWSGWLVASNSRAVGVTMVALTVLLLVAALTATLGGPDDALEQTASLRWPSRRVIHLLGAFLVVVVLLGLTLPTGARFGPAWLVVRDAAGLLGLTALGAATIGTARAWFLPLGWTLPAALFTHSETLAGQIVTWQAQPPSSTAAAVTAGLLALGGLIAYAATGPALRAPAEAAQH